METFKLIIASVFLTLNLFGQSSDYSIETTTLELNFHIIKIKGPSGIYDEYLYEGDINNFEPAYFKPNDLSITSNNRDDYDKTIDFGFMPSDILYYSNHEENIYVYGNDKVLILDGENHINVEGNITVSEKENLFSSSFLPLIPYRYQLAATVSHVICATNDGKLVVIDPIDKEIHQEISENNHAIILSNSVKFDPENELIVWVRNFWDGTAIIETFSYDPFLDEYIFVEKLEWNDNEIIDFALHENVIRIALLNSVIELDYNLAQLSIIPDMSIDKLEESYGHIKGEPKIYQFGAGEFIEDTDLVENALGSCFDEDNGIIYFSGIDNNSKFKICNHSPTWSDQVKSFYQPGVISIAFNPNHSMNSNFYTVASVGLDTFIGFDDNGNILCENNMDCLFGYRIAIDLNLNGFPESNGTLVACLRDGLLHQFIRMTCRETQYHKLINTGMRSSLAIYSPDVKKVFFFYNASGVNNTFFSYNETTGQTQSHSIDFGQVNDCIYNENIDRIFVAHYNPCENARTIIEFNDIGQTGGSYPVLGIPEILMEFDNNIYCAAGNYLYQLEFDNSGNLLNNDYLTFGSKIIALEKNENNSKIYALFQNENEILEVDHLDFENFVLYTVVLNDPRDICYNSNENKVYVANYGDQNIKCFNASLNYLESINVTGKPKKLEYNSYQNNIYAVSDYDGFSFNYFSVIDCENDEFLKHHKVRKSDGIIYDKVNDQLYLHTNYPSEDNNFEFNIKAFDNFTDDFSNEVGTSSYTYTDILLNEKKLVQSKPAFSYEDNKIYVGNYGLASASIINPYEDIFTYKPGWNWLSFPRLERYQNNIFETIPLLKRITPWPPDELEMIYQPYNTSLTIYYDGEWYTSGGLINVNSSQGYKLNYVKNVPDFSLRLEGTKLDYDTEIDLVAGENWVGYFLDKKAKIEDCLPADLWDKLTQIKTQHWSMTKEPWGPNYWLLKGKVAPIKYGDLVVLKTNAPYENFQWQLVGEDAGDKVIPKPSYFTYEEQADYLPFYIETDSTSGIQEIAVLADGEVKGAAVRETGDTLVEVKAYLEGATEGAVIEFETWDGYKSQQTKKGGYVVINHKRLSREKRNIYTGDKATHYHVSLKSAEVYELPSDISMVTNQPNPFRQNTEFSFQLNRGGNISLEIYNLGGNLVKTVIDGNYPEGFYRFTWNGNNNSGSLVKPGIYFYKVNTSSGTVFTDKLVLIN